MSNARAQLIGRVQAIRDILASPISVDVSPVPSQNSGAVVVRNGCMVMLFCALEAFIRDRSLECARTIDQAHVPYSYLPEGLKVASVIATFEGLTTLSRGWGVGDKIIEFEKAVVAAASGSLGNPYQFTDYSFARDKSNITSDDVAKISKAFGVDNFWNSARAVSTKAGISIPGNMDEVFKGLARERHKAAHVSSHNVPHSQLAAALPQTMALAISFDSLVSFATNRLSTSNIAGGVPPTPVNGTDVDFVEVRMHTRGRWAAFAPNRIRALFTDTNSESALTRASAIARPKLFSVIKKDSAGRLSAWRSVIG